MEKKYDVEIRWGEIVKVLTERYPGKAYGSYMLMPKEENQRQHDEVCGLLTLPAFLTKHRLHNDVFGSIILA